MDPLHMITIMKYCIIINFILAFLLWNRQRYTYAKFLAVLSLIDVLLISGIKFYM